MSSLRIVFFGTSEFAVPSLVAIASSNHSLLAVVTQPDKPQGRGRQVALSPVKRKALELGLPVLQPRRVRSEKFVDKLRTLSPDLIALASFGQIIPQNLLDLPPLGPINVHGSLLPAYRGAAPIQRAIMAGESVTGITTMWMEATLDTGDILLQASLPIEDHDTAGTLTERMADLGADLLIDTIRGLSNGSIVRTPQNSSLATLAPALTPKDSHIDWHETAFTISCQVRGVNPKPGAFSLIAGKQIKIWSASATGSTTNAEPGCIINIEKQSNGVDVAAGNNSVLRICEAQPENGRRMDASAWARGMRLKPGDQFNNFPAQ